MSTSPAVTSGPAGAVRQRGDDGGPGRVPVRAAATAASVAAVLPAAPDVVRSLRMRSAASGVSPKAVSTRGCRSAAAPRTGTTS